MTVSSAGGQSCRELRLLLGVYVVGAIGPADRSAVDEHLGECAACRDELAGLAGLPALLSRVPAVDVDRLGPSGTGLPDMSEPPAELLNSLLRRLEVRRKTRMWRGITAAAAAAVIAVGGTTVVLDAFQSPHSTQAAAPDVARGVNSRTHVTAVVDYTRTAWGTAMRVQVTGIPAGTTCQLWVIDKNGRSYASSWRVGASYGNQVGGPYPASSPVAPGSVRGFQITAKGKVLVTIPAS